MYIITAQRHIARSTFFKWDPQATAHLSSFLTCARFHVWRLQMHAKSCASQALRHQQLHRGSLKLECRPVRRVPNSLETTCFAARVKGHQTPPPILQTPQPQILILTDAFTDLKQIQTFRHLLRQGMRHGDSGPLLFGCASGGFWVAGCQVSRREVGCCRSVPASPKAT